MAAEVWDSLVSVVRRTAVTARESSSQCHAMPPTHALLIVIVLAECFLTTYVDIDGDMQSRIRKGVLF